MRETPNLLLKLPDPTDYVLVEDLNENFTKLDTEIAKITDEETGVEAKLTTHLDDDALIKHKARQISVVNPETQAVQNMQTFAEGLFTSVSNGKDLVGTAITDVDSNVNVPSEPTFFDLATAIGQISTGKKWASGTTLTVSNNILNITGLTFKPTIIAYTRDDYLSSQTGARWGIFIDKINLNTNNHFYAQKTSVDYANFNNLADLIINNDGFVISVTGLGSAVPVYWIAIE